MANSSLKIFSITCLVILVLPMLISNTAVAASVVGTTNYRDMWPAYAQRTFHANGLFWVFWYNGTDSGGNELYSSSADGVTWSTAKLVNDKTTSSTRTYSIYFDGKSVHNAMVYLTAGGEWFLVYNRGTPNKDGAITWGTEQLVLAAPPQVRYDFIQICVDSNGYPWIAYETFNFVDGASYPFVIRSSTNDGTWNTPLDFPHKLSSVAGTAEASAYGQGVYPLNSGRVVAFYGFNNVFYAEAWTGEKWLPQISIRGTLGGEHSGNWQWSAVSKGNSVNVACLSSNSSVIDHFTYEYSTNSFSPVTQIAASGLTPFSR